MARRNPSHPFRFLLVLWIAVLLTNGADGCDVGSSNPSANIAALGPTTDGRSFLIDTVASGCCGSLTTWKFHANTTGTLTAMVWRPTSGSSHKLIHTEDLSVTGIGLSSLTPAAPIAIKIGDKIGWKTTGAEMIPSSAGTGTAQNQLLATVSLNTEVPWAGAVETKDYAFGAVVTENVAPTVTAATVTKALTDVSQNIHDIVIVDTDTSPITDLTVTMTPVSSELTLQQSATGFYIQTGSSLTEGTYPMTVKAEDACGATGTAVITVIITGQVPVFSPTTLESVYGSPISDKSTTSTSLYSFSVTDSDPITCTVDNSLFTITYTAPNHILSLNPTSAGALNYDTAPSVSTTISCTDGTNTITSTYTVNISDEPPVLTGLGTSSTLGDHSATNELVASFTVTDQDDDITCTVDAPYTSDFNIVEVSTTLPAQTFEVRTAVGLDQDSTASYSIQVTCTDGQTPVTGTHTLTVTDQPPTMAVFPATSATQNDGVQAGAVIYSISVTDTNDLGDIVCSIVSPNDVLFSITGTPPDMDISTIASQTLSAASAPYLVVITCRDDEPSNMQTGTLTVPLVDTPPTFVGTFPASYSSLSDDTIAQTVLDAFTVSETNINCWVTDPSPSPYETVQTFPPADATTSEFNIQVASTVLQTDINFDDGAVVQLTIVCSDGTTNITGYFDVNIVDAAPALNGLPAAPYSSVLDSATAAEQLVPFTVTDSDDTMSCVVDAGDPSFAVFEITGTAPNFWISLKASAPLDADTTPSYTVPVTCSTDDTPEATVTGTQVINISSAPPVFVNMSYTVSGISDATGDISGTATIIHSFSVTDTPTATITCSLTAPAPYDNDFTIVDSSPSFQVQIEAVNDLNFNAANSVPVSVTCTDGFNSITEILTVELYDEDPVWDLLPATGPYKYVQDTNATASQLYVFSVNDSDDTISCGVDSGTPEATSFEVRPGTPPVFEIWYKGTPPATLDASTTPSHNLSIVCTDGASYTRTELYQVDLENSPASFVNLPDATPTIAESETSKVLLYTFTATDKTELDCYLSSPADVPGITLEDKSYTSPPNTVYNVYAHNTGGFDYDIGTGALSINISCTDKVTAVSEVLTVGITNSAPVITNPGGTYTLPEDVADAATLKTLDILAFDSNDVTCTMTNDDGGPFIVDGTTIKKSAVALDYETKASYTLAAQCVDTLGEVASDTIIVNVENTPLQITNLPNGGTIREDTVDELLSIILEFSEDVTVCYQTDSETEFIVKMDPVSNEWSVFYVSEDVAGKPLDWQTKDYYQIDVVCEDASGVPGPVTPYFISIIPNEPPTFTNLAVNTVHEINAKDVLTGDTVYAITTSDPEGDDVTVNLVSCSDSTTCPFSITDNNVVSNSDLFAHPDDFYVLTVEIEDKYNQNVETRELIIYIKDINTLPTITNIPTFDVVGITENNAAGDVVFKISVDDPDTDDPDTTDDITCICDFTDGGEAFFECDGTTCEIKAKSSLDYESMLQREFNVNVTVTDGYNITAATELLKIAVNHENEQPTFTQTTWTLTKADEGGNGDVVGCPEFYDGISDDDKPNLFEYFTYTMDCPGGEGVFQMDSLTGCVTMTKEWDLDHLTKRTVSETIPCTVTATDYDGLQTTATLNIEINDEDDNPPYLDQTSYKFCATVGTTSGTLSTITANDNDVAAANRDLTFDFPGGGPFGTNGNDGTLTYGDLSGYAVGTTFETTVRVTDAAGHTDSAPVTVIVCDPPDPTTNTNDNSSSSSSSSTDSMLLWLIPVILLGLLLLGLLAFLLYKYCLKGRCKCCRRTKPRKIKVIRRELVRKEEPPVIKEKKPPETLPVMELPIMHNWARNIGNGGVSWPTGPA